jgi:hypothetical protein
VTEMLDPLPSKGVNTMALVSVAVATGMGCGGGLLLAVLALAAGTVGSGR